MKLTETQISNHLNTVKNWVVEEKSITKSFEFEKFEQSVSFFLFLADVARELKHHPDFHNSHTRCQVTLSTHDEGGVTEKDFEFARKIDEFLV